MTANRPPLVMSPGIRKSFETIFNPRKCALIAYLLSDKMQDAKPRYCDLLTADLIASGHIKKFADVKPLLAMLKQMHVIEVLNQKHPNKGILKRDSIRTTLQGREYLRTLPTEVVKKATLTTAQKRQQASISHRFPEIPKPKITLRRFDD